MNADVSEIDVKLKELDLQLSMWPEPPTKEQIDAASKYIHRRTLTEQFEQQKQALAELESKVDVPDAEDVAKLLELVRNNKAQVTASILSAKKRKELLKAGKCPLTGSEPCPDLLALSNTEQVNSDVAKLEAELQSLSADEAALSAAYNDALKHSNAITNATSKLADTEKLLALCEVPEDFDYTAYEEATKVDFSERDRLLGERAQLQQRRIDLCLKLESLKDVEEHTAEEIEAAKKALEESRNAAAEYRALENSIKAAEKHVADCASSLNFALEQNSRADKVIVKRDFLEKVRAALHQDNLPRMLVEDMLVELNARLNQRLTEFNFQYEVSWMPGGALMYREGSGDWHKAAQLSGGQKYVLVLALRCAILEMLHSKFKLFVLDEPTTGLDRANREALSSVLLKVASSDLKPILVVPTHDELLLPEAKVIELS